MHLRAEAKAQRGDAGQADPIGIFPARVVFAVGAIIASRRNAQLLGVTVGKGLVMKNSVSLTG